MDEKQVKKLIQEALKPLQEKALDLEKQIKELEIATKNCTDTQGAVL